MKGANVSPNQPSAPEQKERRSRIYEVPVSFPARTEERTVNQEDIYLVEAVSQSEAWKYVADKFVGKPSLPNGKRIAELMGQHYKVESAKAED